MVGFFARSHRKLLYIALASFLLLFIFLSSQIPKTSTRWIKSALTGHSLNAEEAVLPSAYTAAIIYLARISRVSEILESLASINRNLTGHPWPVVLFHAGDFEHDSIMRDFIGRIYDYIGTENGSDAFLRRVEFVQLEWQLPKGISEDKEIVDPLDSSRWPEYHHILSFFGTEIFSHPRLANITYIMRMDPGAQITQPLCYDPFEFMHVRQRSYGYLSIGSDPQEYTQELWPFVHNYAQTHKSVDRQLRANKWEWSHRDENGDESLRFRGYETDFEIVKLAAFRRPDVWEWLDALKNYTEGIYKWRWGDAPLRYATVQMFFDAEKDTERLCGIRYSNPDVRYDECPCRPLPSGDVHESLGSWDFW